MQALTHRNDSHGKSKTLRTQNQYSHYTAPQHFVVREAVDAWQKTLPGKAQEAITMLVVHEWQKRGGRGLQFGSGVRNNRQNLFRWLDNPLNSKRYAGYIAQLAPVIADVMPIEIARQFGLKQGQTEAELVAAAIKECAEAQQAKMLGAAQHVLEKEVKEGIEALIRLIPPDCWGPVLRGVASILEQCF